MPTHQRKRFHDAIGVEDRPRRPEDGENHEGGPEEEDRDDHDDAEAEESDRSSSSSDTKDKEFVVVNLSEVRKEVQCPICLGIIRKTRTVMECLHRFCRECIDKSMRLGNNECPACRTHCASRRSLRDDKNFDKLIAYLYPDVDKYEEEELTFSEMDKARSKEEWNMGYFKQIQANIAKAAKRQSEAVVKKRSSKRTATMERQRKSRHNLRDNYVKGKRNLQTDDTSDDEGRESSSADECYTDVRPRRSKRAKGVCSSQPSATNSSDRSSDGNNSDEVEEPTGTVSRLLGPSERLAWGKGGTRSNTRHGNGSGGNAKNAQNNRVAKLADYLQNLKKIDNEMDVHIMLISKDEKKIPNLQQPYLSCRPTLSVKSLCRYIALQNAAQADEIEIYVVKESRAKVTGIDPSKDELKIVSKEDNLGGLRMYGFNHGYVVLAYHKKGSNESET